MFNYFCRLSLLHHTGIMSFINKCPSYERRNENKNDYLLLKIFIKKIIVQVEIRNIPEKKMNFAKEYCLISIFFLNS